MPTLLYGYGGFALSMTPSFSATYAWWIEHGGAVAITVKTGSANRSRHRTGAGPGAGRLGSGVTGRDAVAVVVVMFVTTRLSWWPSSLPS